MRFPGFSGRPAIRARLGEQRRFILAADPLGHFAGVVDARRAASPMAKPHAVEFAGLANGILDGWPLVVPVRKIEADWPSAAGAIVAIARL